MINADSKILLAMQKNLRAPAIVDAASGTGYAGFAPTVARGLRDTLNPPPRD